MPTKTQKDGEESEVEVDVTNYSRAEEMFCMDDEADAKREKYKNPENHGRFSKFISTLKKERGIQT